MVVLAPSLGREAVTSWRALHILGLRLAERGFASVRFDWRGTGDSAPLGKDVSPVEVWSEDLQQAQDLALQLSGGLPVSTIGLRLGASLVHHHGAPVSGKTILWEPVGGKAYLRLHQKLRALSIGIPVAGLDEGVELSGSFFTPAQARSLATVKAPRPDDLRPGTLIRTEQDRDEAERLYFSAPRYARVPLSAIDELIDALGEGPVKPLANWSPVAEAFVDVSGTRVLDRFVRVGPHGLHAILSQPLREPVIALDFTSAGGEPLDGPSGLWTEAAHRAAASGAICLRAERRSLGVHLDHRAPVEPIPYSQEAVDDVVESIRYLRSITSAPVAGVGLCVGAWLFLRAGTIEFLDRLVAFDNVIWVENLDFIGRFFRDPMLKRFLAERPASPASPEEGAAVARPGIRTAVKERLKRMREVARRRPLRARRLLARCGQAEYPYQMLHALPPGTVVDLHFGLQADAHFNDVHGMESLDRLRAGRRQVHVSRWADLDHSLLAHSARMRVLDTLAHVVP
ncbi:hypothetical protein [Arsenicicoccus dermatophilus]|uniref:hypothetical protein n=1 Tax=Arsenicicoccus dermatophilus TaxID=1076331 RepID=UPI001F4CE707|nr:hypothetical protein [Arsenicicoccus dermatophilus]